MTCCHQREPKHLWIGLLNNDLFADWRGTLSVRLDAVSAARELWRDRPLSARKRIELEIKAGDVAVVDLRLE